MKSIIGVFAWGLMFLTAGAAWGQFPLGAPVGAPFSPYFSPVFPGYPVWQARTNPLTGAIESRAVVVDPATGNVVLHQRVIPRRPLGGPPAVFDRTIDPAAGVIRHNAMAVDPFTGELNAASREYYPLTGSYERRQTTFDPSGTTQTSREVYDSSRRRTRTEVLEFDPQTGAYYRRGGEALHSEEEKKPAEDRPRRQTKVYEWPPQKKGASASQPAKERP